MAKNIFDMFTFFCLCLWTLNGVFGAEQSLSVMEGQSVTLNPNLTKSKRDGDIEWRSERIPIAKLYQEGLKNMFPDSAGGKYTDRLELNEKTASLTITDTRATDSGIYHVFSSTTNTPLSSFTITVYALLPVPVIKSSSSSPSSSKCELLCSVANVHHVTLSWLRGNSVLSSISLSDLSNTSLPLEIQCLNDSYSCVVSNSFTNQTTHLNAELCQTCSDPVHCCGPTEAVIRLALSGVVGMATVVILVYDIRSRRPQKRKEQRSLSHSEKTDVQESSDVI